MKRQFFTETETADYLGISKSNLQKQRFNRRGLRYYKFNRSVRYSLDDIKEYAERHRVDPQGRSP